MRASVERRECAYDTIITVRKAYMFLLISHVPIVIEHRVPVAFLKAASKDSLDAAINGTDTDFIRSQSHDSTVFEMSSMDVSVLGKPVSNPENPQRRKGRTAVGIWNLGEWRYGDRIDDQLIEDKGEEEDQGKHRDAKYARHCDELPEWCSLG